MLFLDRLINSFWFYLDTNSLDLYGALYPIWLEAVCEIQSQLILAFLLTYVPKSWSHNLCQPGGASSHATCIMKCLSHHALYMESSFQPVGLCTCSLHCLQYSLLAFALASTLSFFRVQMSPPWRSLPWPSHFSWHALILYLTCSHCLYGCYHNLERSCQYTVFV